MTDLIKQAYFLFLTENYNDSALLLLSLQTQTQNSLFLLSKIAKKLNNQQIAEFVFANSKDYRILANIFTFHSLRGKILSRISQQNLSRLQIAHVLGDKTCLNYQKILNFDALVDVKEFASQERRHYKGCRSAFQALQAKDLRYMEQYRELVGDANCDVLGILSVVLGAKMDVSCVDEKVKLACEIDKKQFSGLQKLLMMDLNIEQKVMFGIVFHRNFGGNLQDLASSHAAVQEIFILADQEEVEVVEEVDLDYLQCIL